MVSNIFYFHPYLGKISHLTNIFQMGWNHQPEKQNIRKLNKQCTKMNMNENIGRESSRNIRKKWTCTPPEKLNKSQLKECRAPKRKEIRLPFPSILRGKKKTGEFQGVFFFNKKRKGLKRCNDTAWYVFFFEMIATFFLFWIFSESVCEFMRYWGIVDIFQVVSFFWCHDLPRSLGRWFSI